jgi:hypothetical protein
VARILLIISVAEDHLPQGERRLPLKCLHHNTNTTMKKTLLSTFAILGVSVLTASAITIGYSVDGWGPVTYSNGVYQGQQQPGDTVELLPYSDLALDLPANTPVTGKINTLSLKVNYTWPSEQVPITVNRNMTMSLVIAGLTQNGLFDSWFTYSTLDSLWLYGGGTTTFDLGAQGSVDVTPLSASIAAATNGNYLTDVNATFVWHPTSGPNVPDGGTTLVLLGGALTGLGALRPKLRR